MPDAITRGGSFEALGTFGSVAGTDGRSLRADFELRPQRPAATLRVAAPPGRFGAEGTVVKDTLERTQAETDEARAITRVVGRLHEQFAGLDLAVIERTVHRHLAGFEGARIRDFVPILVERLVKQELRSLA